MKIFIKKIIINFCLPILMTHSSTYAMNSSIEKTIYHCVKRLKLDHNQSSQRPYHSSPVVGKKSLVESFGEIITKDSSHHHLHVYSHWTKSRSNVSQKLVLLDGNDATNSHTNFHRELSKKIEAIADKKLEKLITADAAQNLVTLPFTVTIDGKVNGTLKKNREEVVSRVESGFIPGHFLTVEGVTTVPKVLLTVYAESDMSSKYPRRFIDWWVPIEQALLCKTLKEYRENIAILKTWNSYSTIGLAVIPAGTTVSFRFGLAAPQRFPAISDPCLATNHRSAFDKGVSNFYNALENIYPSDIDSTLNFSMPREELMRKQFEYLPGGASQIFVMYANLPSGVTDTSEEMHPGGIPIYKLEELCRGEKGEGLSFVGKNHATNKWEELKGRTLHLGHENYDNVSFDLILALERAEILLSEEASHFRSILKKYNAK